MRWSTAAVLMGGVFASSDAAPGCGGCVTKRTVVTVASGAHCGSQGRDYLALCHEPMKCLRGKRAHANICTMRCTTDAECSAVDPALRCTDRDDTSYMPDAASAPWLCSRLASEE